MVKLTEMATVLIVHLDGAVPTVPFIDISVYVLPSFSQATTTLYGVLSWNFLCAVTKTSATHPTPYGEVISTSPPVFLGDVELFRESLSCISVLGW